MMIPNKKHIRRRQQHRSGLPSAAWHCPAWQMPYSSATEAADGTKLAKGAAPSRLMKAEINIAERLSGKRNSGKESKNGNIM